MRPLMKVTLKKIFTQGDVFIDFFLGQEMIEIERGRERNRDMDQLSLVSGLIGD